MSFIQIFTKTLLVLLLIWAAGAGVAAQKTGFMVFEADTMEALEAPPVGGGKVVFYRPPGDGEAPLYLYVRGRLQAVLHSGGFHEFMGCPGGYAMFVSTTPLSDWQLQQSADEASRGPGIFADNVQLREQDQPVFMMASTDSNNGAGRVKLVSVIPTMKQRSDLHRLHVVVRDRPIDASRCAGKG